MKKDSNKLFQIRLLSRCTVRNSQPNCDPWRTVKAAATLCCRRCRLRAPLTASSENPLSWIWMAQFQSWWGRKTGA